MKKKMTQPRQNHLKTAPDDSVLLLNTKVVYETKRLSIMNKFEQAFPFL